MTLVLVGRRQPESLQEGKPYWPTGCCVQRAEGHFRAGQVNKSSGRIIQPSTGRAEKALCRDRVSAWAAEAWSPRQEVAQPRGRPGAFHHGTLFLTCWVWLIWAGIPGQFTLPTSSLQLDVARSHLSLLQLDPGDKFPTKISVALPTPASLWPHLGKWSGLFFCPVFQVCPDHAPPVGPGASPVTYLSLSFLVCNTGVVHLLCVHGKRPAQGSVSDRLAV